MTGHRDLIKAVAKAHQFLVFTTAPNLQRAVAFGLQQENDYFDQLNSEMKSKRDRLSASLNKITGFKPVNCQGTYFLFVDIAETGFSGTDIEFCKYITTEAGVTAVPVSAFYKSKAPGNFIRFCFAKEDVLLDKAAARLATHFS